MVINQAQLLRAVPNLYKERVDEAVAAINMWAAHYDINTPKRMAAFLANAFHECGNLKTFVENLNYSRDRLLKVFPKYFNESNVDAYARQPEKIANRVYASRVGNGDEKSGDGWKFRGRGVIQITFRANYKAYGDSDLCVGNPVTNPDILAKYPEAYKSAMWFFQKNGCNQLADRGDFEGVVKRINGGLNGYAERSYLYRRFCREFGVN